MSDDKELIDRFNKYADEAKELYKEYLTPEGYRCFTEQYLLKRGYCCESGCRHCPYGFDKKTGHTQ